MTENQKQILERISESLEIIKPYALKNEVPPKQELKHLSVVWSGLNEVYSGRKGVVLNLGCSSCLVTATKQAHNHFVHQLGKEEHFYTEGRIIDEEQSIEDLKDEPKEVEIIQSTRLNIREEYKAKFGKHPHHKMTEETIIKKLNS